jgi:hypothetical protein
MNILTLLGYIGLAALSFSVMFVAARVYFSYIKKDEEEAQCPEALSGIGHCNVAPKPEPKKTKAKPASQPKKMATKKTTVKKKAITKKVPTKKTSRTKQA